MFLWPNIPIVIDLWIVNLKICFDLFQVLTLEVYKFWKTYNLISPMVLS